MSAQRSRVSCAALIERNDVRALPDVKIATILLAACGVSYTRLLGRGISERSSEPDRMTLTNLHGTRHQRSSASPALGNRHSPPHAACHRHSYAFERYDDCPPHAERHRRSNQSRFVRSCGTARGPPERQKKSKIDHRLRVACALTVSIEPRRTE